MKLQTIDRATGDECVIDSKEDGAGFHSTIRRLAGILGRPIAEVQEALVCGNTYTTAGFSYTLIE